MRFPDFAGNAGIKTMLCGPPLSHAYIIAGPAGMGKRTLAGLISAAMVCSGTEPAPCLACTPCRKAINGTHPDIIHVENDGKGILVDQVRAMRSNAYIRPNEALRKVYIVHDVQKMNDFSQNAMLHLLEEGPPYAAFLLLAETAAALLPTVRSRCIELMLAPVSSDEAFFWLQEHFPEREEQERRSVSVRCQGNLGRAVAELETDVSEGFAPAAEAAEFIARLTGGNELSLAEYAVTLEKCSRNDLISFLDAVLLLLRDGLVCHMGGVVTPEGKRAKPARKIAETLTKQTIMGTIERIETLQRQCKYNLGAGHCAGRLAAACWEGIL